MTLNDTAELVETRLDDLQAEMEAAERCATKLRVEAAAVDKHLEIALRTAEQTGQLTHRVAELQRSMGQQRELMRQLRAEVRTIRTKLAGRRAPRSE